MPASSLAAGSRLGTQTNRSSEAYSGRPRLKRVPATTEIFERRPAPPEPTSGGIAVPVSPSPGRGEIAVQVGVEAVRRVRVLQRVIQHRRHAAPPRTPPASAPARSPSSSAAVSPVLRLRSITLETHETLTRSTRAQAAGRSPPRHCRSPGPAGLANMARPSQSPVTTARRPMNHINAATGIPRVLLTQKVL